MIDAAAISQAFAIPDVFLLNDLEAIANAVPHLEADDLVTLNAIGDAVITTDEHNKVTYMHPAAEKLTGQSCTDAHNRFLRQVITFVQEIDGEDLYEPVDILRRNGGAILDLGEREVCAQHSWTIGG